MLSFTRRAVFGLSLLALTACSDAKVITEDTPLVDLGDFAFGRPPGGFKQQPPSQSGVSLI